MWNFDTETGVLEPMELMKMHGSQSGTLTRRLECQDQWNWLDARYTSNPYLRLHLRHNLTVEISKCVDIKYTLNHFVRAFWSEIGRNLESGMRDSWSSRLQGSPGSMGRESHTRNSSHGGGEARTRDRSRHTPTGSEFKFDRSRPAAGQSK